MEAALLPTCHTSAGAGTGLASCPMCDLSTGGWAVPAASPGEAVCPKGC